MRIDGGTKAGAEQQSGSRFEQVMSRELARSSSGKTPTETNTRTNLAATSKKKAPGSERVGVGFKESQAGKVMKGMQESTRNAFTKAMTLTMQTAKAAIASLGKAVASTMSKAQSSRDGVTFRAFGTDGATGKAMGDASGKTGAGLEAGVARQPGDASSSRSARTATGATNGRASAPSAMQSATPSVLRADGPVVTTGTDRGAALVFTDAGAPITTMTGAVTDGVGAQEGRAALAPQEASTTQEALLLLGPGLQGVARRATENGGALSMVYMLSPNAHGAEFVSITNDDRGFITGPEIDIALTDGAVDTTGNWVALAGDGTLGGKTVVLEPDADGCVFVTDGLDGVPASVTAWVAGGNVIRADVLSVRKLT